MILYIKWASTSLFIIFGKLLTLSLPIKSHLSLRSLFFWSILVSNYHGCEEEAINLIPHYLIDIISKTVKPLHLEKLLQIIQNVQNKPIIQNKLMFKVIFTLSDWILIEQIIAFSTLSGFGETFWKNSTWSFEWGTGAWVKMHRFNAFSRNGNCINWKNFPAHVRICKSEKIQQEFWSRR